jgi:hypothetical protein
MSDPIADALDLMVGLMLRSPSIRVSVSKNGTGDYVLDLAKDGEWVRQDLEIGSVADLEAHRGDVADVVRSMEFQLVYKTEQSEARKNIEAVRAARARAGT